MWLRCDDAGTEGADVLPTAKADWVCHAAPDTAGWPPKACAYGTRHAPHRCRGEHQYAARRGQTLRTPATPDRPACPGPAGFVDNAARMPAGAPQAAGAQKPPAQSCAPGRWALRPYPAHQQSYWQ